MKRVIKKTIFVVLFLCSLMMGCIILDVFDYIVVEPNKLPKAVVGKPYSVDVEVPGVPYYIGVEIIPKDALSWKQKTKKVITYSLIRDEESGGWVRDENGNAKQVAEEVEEISNEVTIYGTPTKKGVITVKFFGADYPTMWNSSKEINTTRKIIVTEE